MMYRYRILEDPTYIDKATEHEKEVANTIQSIIDTGVVPEGFEIEIGHCIAEAFTGMKVKDFTRYVRDLPIDPRRASTV